MTMKPVDGSEPAIVAAEAQFQTVSSVSLKLLTEWASSIYKNIQALNTSFDSESRIELQRGIDFYEEVRRFEVQLIIYALDQTEGHQRQAARLLGLKSSTLNAKLRLYNISARNLFKSLPVRGHRQDGTMSIERD